MARRLLLIGVLLLVTVAAAGAAGGAGSSGTAVKLGHTKLGSVLVNGQGRTLYLFEADKGGKSACNGRCASFWPPLLTVGMPQAGAGVKSSLLGMAKRSDGRFQVTYANHPLYRYVKDARAGQTAGENVDAFGAEWYAVSAAGKKVEPKNSGSTPGYPGDGRR